MGFDEFLATVGEGSVLRCEPTTDAPDVVVPLQLARDSGGAQMLSHLLWHQLERHVAPEVSEAVTEGVWEMVANALEHSGSDALIMGQVYRSPRGRPPDHDDRVQVVIGDLGRGIRASFLESGARKPKTDAEAIQVGLEYPRVTIGPAERVEQAVAYIPGVIVALSLPLYPG